MTSLLEAMDWESKHMALEVKVYASSKPLPRASTAFPFRQIANSDLSGSVKFSTSRLSSLRHGVTDRIFKTGSLG